jgi:hypothetical protein
VNIVTPGSSIGVGLSGRAAAPKLGRQRLGPAGQLATIAGTGPWDRLMLSFQRLAPRVTGSSLTASRRGAETYAL